MILQQLTLQEPGAARGREPAWQRLADFSLASDPGSEQEAIRRVALAVQPLALSRPMLDRLQTAVAEAVMNAIEHGNGGRPEAPVHIQVCCSAGALRVCIVDHGDQLIAEPVEPDLAAKLAGLQPARGWGLYLIKNLMDEVRITTTAEHHLVELILYLEQSAAD